MSAQHEIELQVEHPTYRASAGDVECVRNSSPHTQFFLACTFYAAARAHEATLAELAAAKEELAMRNGTLSMAVSRLGGIVEGRPTGKHNFLQRIDELVTLEALAKGAA